MTEVWETCPILFNRYNLDQLLLSKDQIVLNQY